MGMQRALLIGAAAGILAGCAGAASTDDARDGRPVVVSTFTVIADMTRAVGGDAITVESLIEPGVEVHGYEPTPGDLTRAGRADLVLDNGLGLERWFEPFMDRVDAPHITVSEGIEPISIAAGQYAGKADPHAWMSPVSAAVYIENIRDALIELSPEDAETFTANAEDYLAELDTVHLELTEAIDALPQAQRTLVTCEGAFAYLARDAGLTATSLWPVNSDEQGTPGQIADVITVVQDNGVPTVFCESTVSDSAQRQVAREAGAELGDVLYVDSLSTPDGPVPTHLDLLRHDVDMIVAGLSADSTEATGG